MQEYHKVKRFLLYAIGLYIAWFLIYDFWLSDIDLWLISRLTDTSVWILNTYGYNAQSYPIGHNSDTEGLMIQINETDVVSIGPACNGIVLMALFTGFIISFPGPVLKKLVYIPAGILIINLLNIIRIVSLALNSLYHYQTLDFNHKYTFTIILYSVVFIMWMIWVRRYSSLNKYVNTSTAFSKSQTA